MPHVVEATEAEDKSPTPVPWNRVLSIGLVLFVNHFSLMLVIPFTPFMVSDFFPTLEKAKLGYEWARDEALVGV